jgi:ABC-2 type transport system ATP-binding protein
MQPSVITVKNLRKDYGAVRAVQDVSFEVYRGEIFGILGPNGAGKTTTLEIIEGLKKRSAGSVRVLDLDPGLAADAVKQRIGVQLQSASYFEELSLRELLQLFGSFYSKRRDVDELLKEVNLLEKVKSRVGQLSGGQKQRFSIAASLVNDPEIVFLDEPTTGLDPQARRNLWDFIARLKKDNRTVVLTTHYMEEAELLADRVAIVDTGKVAALGTPQELINKLEHACTIWFDTRASRLNLFSGLPNVRVAEEPEPGSYRLVVGQAKDSLPAILQVARQQQLELDHLHVEPATLEDVFLTLTGKHLRD